MDLRSIAMWPLASDDLIGEVPLVSESANSVGRRLNRASPFVTVSHTEIALLPTWIGIVQRDGPTSLLHTNRTDRILRLLGPAVMSSLRQQGIARARTPRGRSRRSDEHCPDYLSHDRSGPGPQT